MGLIDPAYVEMRHNPYTPEHIVIYADTMDHYMFQRQFRERDPNIDIRSATLVDPQTDKAFYLERSNGSLLAARLDTSRKVRGKPEVIPVRSLDELEDMRRDLANLGINVPSLKPLKKMEH